MATIHERVRKDGGITYSVQWREGGKRTGKGCSEPFGDEAHAKSFKAHVEAAGNNWPDGWVKGHGFMRQAQPEPDALDKPTFDDFAHRYVTDILTGVESRTRGDYHTMITQQFGAFADLPIDIPSREHISRWVNTQEAGEPDPTRTTRGRPDPERPSDWLHHPAAPKTIANRHGLLFTIFQAAVEAKLRSDNPCTKTHLPRTDDDIDDDEMTFLEHDEYQRLRAALAGICGGDAVDLADTAVGTGLRWGEISALQVRDLALTGRHPVLRVRRAWKRQDDNTFLLGKPKTKKSRRSIGLSPRLVEILRRNVFGKGPEDFVFTTATGKAWRHGNFYFRRWTPAISAAVAAGLTKRPRPHDLRHTHASWLIAANVPLPKIQERLGHESIVTTIDRYGHLVRTMDSEVADAIDAAMQPVPDGGDDRALHVVR